MKLSEAVSEQLPIFIEADERWTGFSKETKNSVLEIISTLLLQIILESRKSAQSNKERTKQ